MQPQTGHQVDHQVDTERETANRSNRPTPEVGPFVINLSSANTPMALQPPQNEQLQHFKFFISRRLEDGRERFRLHMGYFDSLRHAESLLPQVRETYPSAWAGETPGKRLRAQGGAAMGTPQTQQDASGVPAVRIATPPATSQPPAPMTVRSVEVQPTQPLNVALTPAAVPAPNTAAAQAAGVSSNPRPERRVNRATSPAPLSGAGTPSAPVTSQANTPPTVPVPTERRSSPARLSAPAPATPEAIEKYLSDSQVMRVLEGAPSETGISMLKPEETGTFAALKQSVQANAPVSFAVQLQWSVQPVDLSKVPPLAIFSAYTLYTVESKRDGRRWYGLRLGFFSDALSAKQVALYVRPEFVSVAVVPVTTSERDGATAAVSRSTSEPATAASRNPGDVKLERIPEQPTSEFKLFDAAHEPVNLKPPAGVSAQASAAALGRSHEDGDRHPAQERLGPQTLEQTLEILGADALSVDYSKRHSPPSDPNSEAAAKKSSSRLGRLFGKGKRGL